MCSAVMTSTANDIRKELGDFSSIICFKALMTGIEEALGAKAAMIALVAAGRQRGKSLATSLELSNTNADWQEVTQLLSKALGKEGTRLCLVNNIIEEDDETIKVYCQETICSVMEPQDSDRQLSYTLGALQGAIEEITGKRLRGKQVESILKGSDQDVIVFSVLA